MILEQDKAISQFANKKKMLPTYQPYFFQELTVKKYLFIGLISGITNLIQGCKIILTAPVFSIHVRVGHFLDRVSTLSTYIYASSYITLSRSLHLQHIFCTDHLETLCKNGVIFQILIFRDFWDMNIHVNQSAIRGYAVFL